MKWTSLWIAVALLAAASLVASSRTPAPEPPQQETSEPPPEDVEDFVPSENVPAGSAISFPVDI